MNAMLRPPMMDYWLMDAFVSPESLPPRQLDCAAVTTVILSSHHSYIRVPAAV